MKTRNLVLRTIAALLCLFFSFSNAQAQQPATPEKLQHIRQLLHHPRRSGWSEAEHAGRDRSPAREVPGPEAFGGVCDCGGAGDEYEDDREEDRDTTDRYMTP